MLARLGVIALVFGLAASLGQAQEQTGDTQRQAGRQDYPPHLFSRPIAVDVIEDKAEAEARKREEEEARQREIEDLAAQKGMNTATQSIEAATRDMRDYALYSTILVGVGTVLLLFTLFLTRQANRAAQAAVDVTREMGKKQARAYLYIKIGNFEISVVDNADSSNLVTRVVVTVANSGNTPAYSPVIYYDIQEAIPNQIIPLPNPETMQKTPVNNGFIPPNEDSTTRLSRTFEVDDPVAFQRFDKRIIRFTYCINFLDEFDEERWTPIISGTFHHWPKGSVSFLPDKIHEVQEN
ncbi:hypothetical protein [Sediminimonas qiaohouensis]|uniref:hypothetical protein n=1 Tax=Sediminimonas qiaohouensis TaxID=552061 RepID=UPI0023558EC7|nr:hypothetical protein [Sediminimonas qiaohouensis]